MLSDSFFKKEQFPSVEMHQYMTTAFIKEMEDSRSSKDLVLISPKNMAVQTFPKGYDYLRIPNLDVV